MISVSQANLKFEASPYQADLIYPYTKPQDYYQSKASVKTSKGKLVIYDKQLFDEIDRNMKENMFKFKMACIKPKSVLFDNQTLQIGLLSSIYRHNDKNLVKITMYFGNLTRYEITEFKVFYSGNSCKFFMAISPIFLKNFLKKRTHANFYGHFSKNFFKKSHKFNLKEKIIESYSQKYFFSEFE